MQCVLVITNDTIQYQSVCLLGVSESHDVTKLRNHEPREGRW